MNEIETKPFYKELDFQNYVATVGTIIIGSLIILTILSLWGLYIWRI